ncbi:MAG: TRAP transporter small permease [Aquisalimonadaceae bacterium]
MVDSLDSRADTPETSLHRLISGVCNIFAVLGGLVLVSIMLSTVFHVLGRVLFNSPLRGNFELVEFGSATAIFAFLAYCQLNRGNVIVDFFTARAPARVVSALGMVGDLLYAAIAAVITWRLTLGMLDYRRYGDETMVLGLPTWWGFASVLPSVTLLTLVCLYTAGLEMHGVIRGGRQ